MNSGKQAFETAAETAIATHGGALPQTRFWWADKYAALKVGESQRLIDSFGTITVVTRTADGWKVGARERGNA